MKKISLQAVLFGLFIYSCLFFWTSLLNLQFWNNVCTDRSLSKIVNMWLKDNLGTVNKKLLNFLTDLSVNTQCPSPLLNNTHDQHLDFILILAHQLIHHAIHTFVCTQLVHFECFRNLSDKISED